MKNLTIAISILAIVILASCTKNNQVKVSYESTGAISTYTLNYLENDSLQLIYAWKPAPFGWAMLAGFSTLVLISYLTPPEPRSAITAFFERMREAPEGNELIMLDLPGWFRPGRWSGFWTRYREDMGGFLLAWGFVGFLVVLAWVIMQLPL